MTCPTSSMKFINEIEKILKKYQDPKRAKEAKHIINTQLKYLGIPVPMQRKLAKIGYSFSGYDHKDLRKIWDEVWQTAKTHETMNQGLIYFESVKRLSKEDWEVLKKWAEKIENWEHSDRLAKLIAQLHEDYPKAVYPTLKMWNKAESPWLRRLSVTGLLFFATLRKSQPNLKKILTLVEPLLKDKDPYVQKGVGWTLRESYNIYPKSTLNFIEKNVKNLSATAFSYSTEKISKKDKERLKKMRKR